LRLRQLDFYGKAKEWSARSYLLRTAGLREPSILAWQPLPLILLKLALFAEGALLLYSRHPLLADAMEQGVKFFRLHEIYRFSLPERPFFVRVAGLLFAAVIGYYGLAFLVHQVQALFSTLAVDRKAGRLYYIRGFLVKTDLLVFSIPQMEYVTLKHNLVSRLLDIGTLVVQEKSGERIVVRSVGQASAVLRALARHGGSKGGDEP